ncbi:MAG: AraC family transcriptional regulator [Fibrella sp.]|nr:AraC family transcriptional regulator [Armatimonadota bacterium]
MGETHFTLRENHIPPREPFTGNTGDATRESIISPDLFAPLARRYGILLCGTSDAFAPFCFVRHHPAMWHVLATISGAGEVWRTDTGQWQACRAGSVYVTPPHAPHGYRSVPGNKAWQIAWAHIAPKAVPLSATHPTLFCADGEPFAASIRGLHNETIQSVAGDALISESWVALVRAYALRFCALAVSHEHGVPKGDPRLVHVFTTVAADLIHPWTLDSLARLANLSPEHLRRLCRAEGMESPLRRVTELRLRHAASLLASGFYTVERAASRVGYSNPFAFSTAFKRFFGQPPSAFQARENDPSRS